MSIPKDIKMIMDNDSGVRHGFGIQISLSIVHPNYLFILPDFIDFFYHILGMPDENVKLSNYFVYSQHSN